MLWLLLFLGVLGFAWFLFVPDPGRGVRPLSDHDRERGIRQRAKEAREEVTLSGFEPTQPPVTGIADDLHGEDGAIHPD